ncbi:hypothetical protein [Flavobacterium sp.]
MNTITAFFKQGSPIKLILLAIPFLLLSFFIEKSLPSVFLFTRLLTFVLVIYAVIKFFNSKF